MAAPAKRIAGRGPLFPYPRGLFQLTNSAPMRFAPCQFCGVASPFNAIPLGSFRSNSTWHKLQCEIMLMQLSRHTLSGRRRGAKVGGDMMLPSWEHCTKLRSLWGDEEPLFASSRELGLVSHNSSIWPDLQY